MDLIGEIDLEKLEEELRSERLNFQDVANYISALNVESAKQVRIAIQFELQTLKELILKEFEISCV